MLSPITVLEAMVGRAKQLITSANHFAPNTRGLLHLEKGVTWHWVLNCPFLRQKHYSEEYTQAQTYLSYLNGGKSFPCPS